MRSTFAGNMLKHHMFGPRVEVEMMKKSTALWRKAHFEDMLKIASALEHFWKVTGSKEHAVVREAHRSQHVKDDMFGLLWEAVVTCHGTLNGFSCTFCKVELLT